MPAFYFTLLPENSDLTGFWDSVLSVLFSDLHISEMRFSLGFGPSKCCSVWAVLVLADVWPNNQIQVLSANILLGWGKMNANSSTTMQYESKKSINVVNAYIVVTVQHIFYLQAGKWELRFVEWLQIINTPNPLWFEHAYKYSNHISQIL